MPTYVLATQEDHIVPWRSAYRSTQLVGGKVQFVLGASGHIAGVINPASKNKRSYWIDGKLGDDAEQWLSTAQTVPAAGGRMDEVADAACRQAGGRAQAAWHREIQGDRAGTRALRQGPRRLGEIGSTPLGLPQAVFGERQRFAVRQRHDAVRRLRRAAHRRVDGP